ncbi:biopolymer transporter ExbD [Lyngbya aestuarii]|uniref:biopolymer transporter ExbD n=1 Tax=Lyngbya aestuarii TaxID=118322 RepID=UPI00403D8804
MRFKNRQQSSLMPGVDLIPMLNVMMAVLAFFVMISATMTTEQGVNVQLPSGEAESVNQPDQPEPLLIDLNPQGQILLGNQPINQEQLAEQMKAYLGENTKGAVLLKANPKAPYEKVVQLLGEMQDLGGNRVSLAIEAD